MVAKSSTKRKSGPTKKKVVPVDAIIEKTISMLAEEKANTFLCLKVSDKKYQVGKYTVVNDNSEWMVSKQTNDDVIAFNERVNAVAYCALMHTGRQRNAQEVHTLDHRISQLSDDEYRFKVQLNNAIDKKDEWKIDLYNARYSDTKAHLRSVRDRIQKTLHMAKYIKLWSDQ